MFGHGGPSVAPVSRNYPEMRERLRLLLSKKKKNHKQQQQQQPGQITAAHVQQPAPTTAAANAAAAAPRRLSTPSVATTAEVTVKPAELRVIAPASKVAAVAVTPPSPVFSSRHSSVAAASDVIAKKDVDEIIEYIEGNNNKLSSANEKKRQKKERQKQIKLEELRQRQEEDRRRQEAEQAARRQREEEERRRREEEDKAAKKAKKKQAQKAKKLAAHGSGGQPASDSDVSPAATAGGATPGAGGPSVLDLEALRLKHIQVSFGSASFLGKLCIGTGILFCRDVYGFWIVKLRMRRIRILRFLTYRYRFLNKKSFSC